MTLSPIPTPTAPRLAAVLALSSSALLLAACGGGSSPPPAAGTPTGPSATGASPAPAAPGPTPAPAPAAPAPAPFAGRDIVGHVLIGSRMASGTVTLRCASGPTLSGAVLNDEGFYRVTLGAQVPPCLVAATVTPATGAIGGTAPQTWHSAFATVDGLRVNVSPLTDLAVGVALQGPPRDSFAAAATAPSAVRWDRLSATTLYRSDIRVTRRVLTLTGLSPQGWWQAPRPESLIQQQTTNLHDEAAVAFARELARRGLSLDAERAERIALDRDESLPASAALARTTRLDVELLSADPQVEPGRAVVWAGDRFVMFMRLSPQLAGGDRLAVATSADGRAWSGAQSTNLPLQAIEGVAGGPARAVDGQLATDGRRLVGIWPGQARDAGGSSRRFLTIKVADDPLVWRDVTFTPEQVGHAGQTLDTLTTLGVPYLKVTARHGWFIVNPTTCAVLWSGDRGDTWQARRFAGRATAAGLMEAPCGRLIDLGDTLVMDLGARRPVGAASGTEYAFGVSADGGQTWAWRGYAPAGGLGSGTSGHRLHALPDGRLALHHGATLGAPTGAADSTIRPGQSPATTPKASAISTTADFGRTWQTVAVTPDDLAAGRRSGGAACAIVGPLCLIRGSLSEDGVTFGLPDVPPGFDRQWEFDLGDSLAWSPTLNRFVLRGEMRESVAGGLRMPAMLFSR